MRKIVVRLGLVLGSLMVCFLAAEVVLRGVEAWRGRFAIKWAVYDAELGYRLNPEWQDISDQGFRDHPVGAKGTTPRVLILGDSVAFNGETIDDTWVAHMRHALADEGEQIEVVNTAVRGYTTHQEMLFLERDGLAYEPDLVGLGFVLNDLHEVLTVFQVEDGEIVSTDYDFTDEARAGQSGLYHLMTKSLVLVELRRRLAFAIDGFVLAASGGFSFDSRPDFMTAWPDESWSRVEAQLERLKELGRLQGFEVFVHVTPFGDQYRADYLELDRDYVLGPQRRLAEICRRLDLPLLDLYGALDGELFEDDAVHLTEEGRQRVGRLTADFLIENSLVPSPGPDV